MLQSQGMSVEEAARALEIAPQTYYRWRKEYGDMNTTQARKLKDLERENLQLKKLVADLSLDNAILKEVLSKSDFPGQAQSSCKPSNGNLECLTATRLPGNWTAQSDPTLSEKD